MLFDDLGVSTEHVDVSDDVVDHELEAVSLLSFHDLHDVRLDHELPLLGHLLLLGTLLHGSFHSFLLRDFLRDQRKPD